MPDCNAQKQRSLRRRLFLAALTAATSMTSVARAEPPGPIRELLAPKRLPQVASPAKPAPLPGCQEVPRPPWQAAAVQPCSAELDALVESWFAESETEKQAAEQASNQPAPARWLRSTSSSAATETARRLLTRATRELEVGAWLSAETTAWEAIKWAAESVDLAAREHGQTQDVTALRRLQEARDAIREARDFSGVYGPLDAEAIRRMAISHQTDVLDDDSMAGMTATDASDRYLDHARVLLAPLAGASVEAAHSLDLLAAVYLKRADAKTLPSATALCLRRAALQGQPNNASLASRLGMHLADLGLLDEAKWALEQALTLEPDPQALQTLVQVLQRSGQGDEAAAWMARFRDQVHGTSRLSQVPNRSLTATASDGSQVRIPEIVEVTPQEFASISQSVIPFEESTRSIEATEAIPTPSPASQPTTKTAARTASFQTSSAEDAESDEKPGILQRLFGSWKGIW